ncbi:MAG: HEPN domain-containing protein [Candidatus Binataceae bacterium]
MRNEIEGSKRSGTFTISPGKTLSGELAFKGPNTSLHLHDRASFDTHAIPELCITGILEDLTKVSLIRCVTPPVPGSGWRGKESYYFADIFPHYVIYGDHHVRSADKAVAEIQFVVDDASTLFYDFDAFSSVIKPLPFIEQISHANGLNREILTGPYPAILYFTGKTEIFAVDTLFGGLSAYHNPRQSFGGPDGVYLKNNIYVKLAFKEPWAFEDAVDQILVVLRYLEMLVGRPQNLLELRLRIESDEETPVMLEVYWSTPPKRDQVHEERKPHPADVLLNGGMQPELFSRVTRSWLDRQQTWQDARLRFSNSFAKQNFYDIDRLVGSANMFDILPQSAVPAMAQLSKEIEDAKETCQKIFGQLPSSTERDSVLSSLGRVGKSNLKQKIRHRAQIITDLVGDRPWFPELTFVTDEAVNCRNHYVHGSEPRFNYSENFEAVVFFTNTLEFVFAASDLIEAGWDMIAWRGNGTTMAHPFGAYYADYDLCLQNLKPLLPRRRES